MTMSKGTPGAGFILTNCELLCALKPRIGGTMPRLVAVAVGSAVFTAVVILSNSGLPSSDCSLVWRKPPMLVNYTLPTPDMEAQEQLNQAVHDTLRNVGWRTGVKMARFDNKDLSQILDVPWHHTGALLLVVPGPSAPSRRVSEPFLSLAPEAANLSAALPVNTINAAVRMVEATRGRQLYSFRLETYPLRACRSGDGPCAVWEVSSGRVILDSYLAERMGSVPWMGSVLSHFTTELLGKVEAAAAKLTPGQASLATLSNLFASVGPSALTLALSAAAAGAAPTWFCIACPIVLGMLAPFLFNFGLTAAAEQLCDHFQLPDDQCADLWWAAFALAGILSVGSAIPIVHICHLPDCVKHLVRHF